MRETRQINERDITKNQGNKRRKKIDREEGAIHTLLKWPHNILGLMTFTEKISPGKFKDKYTPQSHTISIRQASSQEL
jgi:hypothetical protein